ncbi:HAD family hydrolase [Tianweitania sp. BSSL-BM11]|uniref:HAD family hydrolase n=1 Tax=Tianweitania aestuarii TaxID=2814886 RepID=A0ABS5RSD7_9HYPH|nr:HAD family hydrolase [Tianweitania aestuarii]
MTQASLPAHPGLVIFDCDGVLVDSEPISIGVLVDHIARAGGDVSTALAYDIFLGRSMATIRQLLRESHAVDFTEDHMEAIRQDMRARFRSELQPIPGIRETLLSLKQPFCVASSSQPDRIRLSLTVTGLIDQFEPNIFSSTMVKRGKPFPDLFLHAASQMGAEPRDCIVVEDSPAGIQAAKSAGMTVLGFAGGAHAELGGLLKAFEQLQPDAVFTDMQQLPDLLQSIKPPHAL